MTARVTKIRAAMETTTMTIMILMTATTKMKMRLWKKKMMQT
jgi:hypothetical protein